MPVRGCYDAAVRLLARREHSQLELRRKLEQREHEAADIAAALERLVAEGLQSDARFAAELVNAKMAGWGRRRLLLELKSRGVAEATALEAVDAGLDETERDRALAALRRKYGDRLGGSQGDSAKARRFLAQRGFDGATAAQAIKDYQRTGD